MDEIAIAIAKRNRPSSEQVTSAVNDWLDDHPEATTTVQDGSISYAKLATDMKQTVDNFEELVIVSGTEPQEDGNKLWIEDAPDSEYSIPTYAEFSALAAAKQDAPAAAGTAGQVLGLDSNLDPVWVDQTPLDRSLSVAAAAAPADLVGELKNAIGSIEDDQLLYYLNETLTKTGVYDYTGLSIPAGTYNIHFDSITSDATGTKCVVAFYAGSSSNLSKSYDRGVEINGTVTFTNTITHIMFYSGGGWSDSQGKTATFSNMKLYQDTGLNKRFVDLNTDLENLGVEIGAVADDVDFIKENALETKEEKWFSGNEAEWYTTSTFSGFATSWQTEENAYVKDIQIKVRSRDETNITKIKARIESGEFVFENTYNVNIGQTSTKIELPVNRDVPAGTVWIAIAANKKATFSHANDGTTYGYKYWTGGDISDLTTLKDGGGSTKKLWIVADVYAKSEGIKLECPDSYDLVVGDVFQLFYKGIVNAVHDEEYYVEAQCTKGVNFRRFFQITPSTAETLQLTLSLYDNKHHKSDEKTISLKIRAKASSPASQTNVLCVGDSLTANGAWPAEMCRRLTGSGGTPSADGLANISFIGSMTKDGAGYEGYGGWKFSNYNSASVDGNAKVITCSHDKTDDDQHSVYKDANNCQWKLETIGEGTIKIIATSAGYGSFPSTGTLTWISGGINHNSIVYTASENAPGNPFWDSINEQVDFEAYATGLGISSIDYVFVLLGWNDAATGEATYKQNAQTFITNVHSSFPDAKIVLMGLEIPARDGIGVNYGANGVYSRYYDLMQYVHNLDKWYDDLAEINENVYHINISGQFDTENNMQTGTRQVNTRNDSTEIYQTNGVHPATPGYLQIADAAYRCMHGLL